MFQTCAMDFIIVMKIFIIITDKTTGIYILSYSQRLRQNKSYNKTNNLMNQFPLSGRLAIGKLTTATDTIPYHSLFSRPH